MRLTDFSSVVSTYKKNFHLRRKKFIDDRKKIIDERRKEREDQIEAVKAVEPLVKTNLGKGSKPKNFLGGIQRFLGFALAGLIVSNLKNIIPVIAEIYKKIKEIFSGIGEIVSGTIGGLQSFYDASTEKIAELNKYIEDFRGIDQSELGKFETETDKFGRGALAIAGVLSSAKFITDILGLGKKPGSGTSGTGPAGKKGRTTTPPPRRGTSVRSRSRVRTPAPVRTPTPARIPTPARATSVRSRSRVRTSSPVRTPAPTPVATPTPTPKPTVVPTEPKVLVGAGTGSGKGTGTGKGKPYFDDLISRTAKPAELASDSQENMMMKKLSNLSDRSLEALAEDAVDNLKDVTSNDPQVRENYIRSMQDKGIRVSDELVGAAGDAAAVKAGALPSEKLVGYTKKFDSAMAAESRLNADLRSQGIKIDSEGKKFVNEMMGEYGEQLRRDRLEKFLGRSTTSTRTSGQRSLSNLKGQKFQAPSIPPARQKATGRMMGKIINFLRFLGITLGAVSLLLLAKEIGEDIQRGDMKSAIVKLSAAGFGAIASTLAYTAGMGIAATDEYVTGSGVGLIKGGAIIAGAAGIGIGVEEGIRRTFLGSPEQPPSEVTTAQPSSSLLPSSLPPLPPTNTLPGGVQSYGAARPGGRKHAGVDFDPADDKNSKFYSRIGGEVIFAGNVGGGYGNVVDIYNKELGYTERIAEGNNIHVKVGDVVKRGTLVQSGSEMTGVFHYEIRKGKAGNSGSFEGTLNPLEVLKNIKPPEEVSMKSSPSNLTSSAGLNQSTTYSEGGVALRREVNNIIIPIAA